MENARDWLGKKAKRLQKLFLNESGLLGNERKRLFLKNGDKLLEALIRSCKDKCRCNLIRSFSAKQVLEATNNFQSHYLDDVLYKWYKGTVDDRPVLIKKYHSNYKGDSVDYYNIAVSSQMSSHKNALKLLGCCLEFTYPVLVYEDMKNGPLGGIYVGSLSLSWNMRLKIAKQMANVITYLHTAFDRPIIHRDIRLSRFLLDKDYVPKLCDFNDIIRIPEDKTQAEDTVIGTLGYIDPVYVFKETITEHTDVYSFGVVLLALLTGKPAFDLRRPERERFLHNYVVNMVEQERFKEILDPKILEEEGGINEEKEQQLQSFLKLALSCTEREREERPLMIDVAKELLKIEKSTH